MVIKLETKEGYEQATLKFKALVEGEYLIVSKVFDEPLEGPSQFCKNTEGKWYKFALTLHEYADIDLVKMKKNIVTDAGEVGFFDGDNEYDVNEKKPDLEPKWVQSQGTLLKALNKAEVGERLKITMIENKKGKMIYNVESLDEIAVTATEPVAIPEPVTVSDNTSASVPNGEQLVTINPVEPAVVEMIKNLKASKVPVDQVINVIKAGNPDVGAELITKVYTNGGVQ